MTFEKIYSLLGQFLCDTMNLQQFLKISSGGHRHENRQNNSRIMLSFISNNSFHSQCLSSQSV